MSFISGEPASANVIADGRVEYMAWPQDKLRALQQLNPGLLVKLQHILGRDLTGKVKAASQRG
jgi:CRP-like cAMP-binding protein